MTYIRYYLPGRSEENGADFVQYQHPPGPQFNQRPAGY